jgi:hypothetical protein
MSTTSRVLAYFICLPLLAASILACGSSASNNGAPGAVGKRWNVGGTLHNKTLLDWQDATAADKLATCGDLVASAWSNKQFRPDMQRGIEGVEDMKPYAEILARELDTVSEKLPDPDKNQKMFANQTVAEHSAAIMILRKWYK